MHVLITFIDVIITSSKSSQNIKYVFPYLLHFYCLHKQIYHVFMFVDLENVIWE